MFKKRWMVGFLVGCLVVGGFSYNVFVKENNENIQFVFFKIDVFIEQEVKLIVKMVVDGIVDDIDRDIYNGKEVYEVEIEKDGEDYDVYVDINIK